jgi:hypothetical protein
MGLLCETGLDFIQFYTNIAYMSNNILKIMYTKGVFMKKPAILIFIFFVACAVYSLDTEGSLDFGILGLGISSEKGIFDGIIFGHIPDITFQTSIGFGINLSLMDFSIGLRELNIISLTFINALIFYDFIKDCLSQLLCYR